jgi:Na+-driven multidrug efflux pump
MDVGVARGAGWQDLGALVNLGTFYCVGVPVGVILAFHFGWHGTVRFLVHMQVDWHLLTPGRAFELCRAFLLV